MVVVVVVVVVVIVVAVVVAVVFVVVFVFVVVVGGGGGGGAAAVPAAFPLQSNSNCFIRNWILTVTVLDFLEVIFKNALLKLVYFQANDVIGFLKL